MWLIALDLVLHIELILHQFRQCYAYLYKRMFYSVKCNKIIAVVKWINSNVCKKKTMYDKI